MHYTFEVHFETTEDRVHFVERLNNIGQLLPVHLWYIVLTGIMHHVSTLIGLHQVLTIHYVNVRAFVAYEISATGCCSGTLLSPI